MKFLGTSSTCLHQSRSYCEVGSINNDVQPPWPIRQCLSTHELTDEVVFKRCTTIYRLWFTHTLHIYIFYCSCLLQVSVNGLSEGLRGMQLDQEGRLAQQMTRLTLADARAAISPASDAGKKKKKRRGKGAGADEDVEQPGSWWSFRKLHRYFILLSA